MTFAFDPSQLMTQATIIIIALLALHSSHTSCNARGVPVVTLARFQAQDSPGLRDDACTAVDRARGLADEIVAASYPEMRRLDIRIKTFRSQSDYFKMRFGIPQYFFAHMRYLLFINPRVFELKAPDAGIRAIIAHELGHVVYFRMHNRLRLLGLVRLTSKRFTAEFERWADLKAISLGYGEGLKEYRRWLYQNIPASKLAEKQRDYFSPEEIDAILSASRARPELLEYWLEHVPLNLKQILALK
jgi:hypothetical protein